MIIRAFLAFTIPTPVRKALSLLARDLQQYTDDVTWTLPEKFHVTVQFFGEIDDAELLGPIAEHIRTQVARIEAPLLDCTGVGVFPNWKYPRVIWTGFSGATESLLQLHEQLQTQFARIGVPPDERRFRLHLTIGRAKTIRHPAALVKRVESLGPLHFGEVAVPALTLYKSQLTNDGSIYTALERFPFQGSG